MATEFPEICGLVKLFPNGPPVQYPVQLRVVGLYPLALRLRAVEGKAVMRQNPDMRGVHDNCNEFVKVVRLEVDQSKARVLGVSSQSVALASRTLLSGSTVGQFRETNKLLTLCCAIRWMNVK